MELAQLGYTDFFHKQTEAQPKEGLEPARITAVNRDNYRVRNQKGECPAELTGRLIYTMEDSLDRPTVGDWVIIQSFDNHGFAVIHGVLERASLLKRKAAGIKTDFQLIAANIDTAFILQATDFSLNRLERYLVMIREGGIQPVILLSKADLFEEDLLEKRKEEILRLQNIGDVILFSNRTNRGIDEIRAKLQPARTYCLLGLSGVGKTTLLNTLTGESLAVREVREKDGRGRHTTTRRQLIMLDNGSMIIDSPGMRELGNFDISEGLAETFSDIEILTAACRFSDCTHIHEKGCAVRAAVESGEIEEHHYRNYLKLRRESAHFERSYLEKRRRDKEFGKMVKQIKKTKPKK